MTATSSPEILENALDAVARAARPTARSAAATRAGWLRHIADSLDRASAELIAIARAETHLTDIRLMNELRRTTFQARLFADRLSTGSFSGVFIDPADADWPMGARPDLRRTFIPIGPVLVFTAGNFPFAFGVAGGDMVSALTAGCPVLVKAHPGHPDLSRATYRVVTDALADAGAPDGVFGMIEGEDAGRAAVLDSRIRAVGFTGSTSGGRALFDLAMSRPEPIPFYAEMSSTNPVIITPRSWATRPAEIAAGFAASLTASAGQLCTKPGVVLVPDIRGFLDQLPSLPAAPMLNDHILDGFHRTTSKMATQAAIARGELSAGEAAPVLFRTTIAEVQAHPELLDLEMFGPAALLVEYAHVDQVMGVIDQLSGQLTASVHGGDQPDSQEAELVARLAEHAGRVLWNDWPTGVSVTDAQQHGGPYPATTAPLSTSVGTQAVWRFLRPVTFQNMPDEALPDGLRRNLESPSLAQEHA